MKFEELLTKLEVITKVTPTEEQVKTIKNYVDMYIDNYQYARPGYRLYQNTVCANNILITLGLNPEWKDKNIFPRLQTVELLQEYVDKRETE